MKYRPISTNGLYSYAYFNQWHYFQRLIVTISLTLMDLFQPINRINVDRHTLKCAWTLLLYVDIDINCQIMLISLCHLVNCPKLTSVLSIAEVYYSDINLEEGDWWCGKNERNASNWASAFFMIKTQWEYYFIVHTPIANRTSLKVSAERPVTLRKNEHKYRCLNYLLTM